MDILKNSAIAIFCKQKAAGEYLAAFCLQNFLFTLLFLQLIF